MPSSSVAFDDWLSDPAPGVRLHVADVAQRLGLSLTDILLGVGMSSKTAIFNAMTHNRWPRLTGSIALKQRLQQLMQERGATDVELATLFCAPRVPVKTAPHRSAASAAKNALASAQSEDDVLLPKQTLTPQAAKHFKVFRNPFDGPVDRDEQFFASDETVYVREVLWQCARNSGFMALVGESGAGKTTIVADLEDRLAKDMQGMILFKPGVLGMEEGNRTGQMLKAADLLHSIISTLDPSGAMPQALAARTVRAAKLLLASTQAGNAHLLVVEEAHCMPDPTLKHLKRLHELRAGRRSLLGILLLAQPELKRRLVDGLRSGTLREVAQRCEIVELLPLDRDLQAYMQCRAEAHGRKLDTFIQAEAIEQLRAKLTRKVGSAAVSLLYPLSVNNAVTKAMNLAAEIGVPTVTAEVVKRI